MANTFMTSEIPLQAVPFTAQNDPEKLAFVLDKCCEHRQWFDDFQWEDYRTRRATASGYLADTLINGHLWEVWRGANLVGILLLTGIREQNDALAHFIFFDHKLVDKIDLCKSVMAWSFERYKLHVLRIEIPTYAKIFARFARKKLGFRYEAEGRTPSWPKLDVPLSHKEAELGSRKHQAILYDGKWCDVLLLSISREEFFDGWTESKAPGRIDSPDAGTDRPSE